MKASEFWDKCRIHDWSYEYSDDGKVFEKGAREEKVLRSLAEQYGYQDIYDAWMKYIFGKGPKPERPAD